MSSQEIAEEQSNLFLTDVISKETGSKDYKDTFDIYPNAPETKYLNKHNMI